MVQWTTFHPQKAYLVQYVYGYLTQGHEGNNDYVCMNPAATEIVRNGVGVYATRRLQLAATTPPSLPTSDAVPACRTRTKTTPLFLRMPLAPQASLQQLGGQLWS